MRAHGRRDLFGAIHIGVVEQHEDWEMTAAMPTDTLKIQHLSTKAIQRMEIEQQVAEYLARGGSVTECDHTANHFHGQPAKRTRRQQVEYLKRFGADRSKD